MEKHTCEDAGCDRAVKVCVKCGDSKPRSEYPRRSAGRDGHRNDCKACRKAYRQSWYEANKEDQQRKNKAWLAKNKEHARVMAKAYREANKAERAAYSKAYRENNRAKYEATWRASREANREKYVAYQRKYFSDKWATDLDYRERQNAIQLRRRRLLSVAVQEPYTRESIFNRDGWVCQLCQEPIDPDAAWPDPGTASIDHIFPVSLGGDDTPDNTQAAHMGCNSRKGNRIVA